MRSDIELSAKRGTVIRENLTRRSTYNPAGGGFHRLVENQPDPDAGYLSIPTVNMYWVLLCRPIFVRSTFCVTFRRCHLAVNFAAFVISCLFRIIFLLTILFDLLRVETRKFHARQHWWS